MAHYMDHALICLCLFYICASMETEDHAWTGYKGRYGHEPSRYEITIPQKVNAQGEFVSHKIPHHFMQSYYSRRKREDMGPDDTVHYKVTFSGEDHHLELQPNHQLLSPGAVLEAHLPGTGADYAAKAQLRRARDVQCHFTGSVRGQNNSRVAVSTCYGLAGYIRTKRGYFVIEPTAGRSALTDDHHPHLVYQRHSDGPGSKASCNCGTKGNVTKELARRAVNELTKTEKAACEATEAPANDYSVDNITDVNLEVLVVLDKTLIDHHRELDLEDYVLTVMNMAHNLYLEGSLAQPINIVIVRIMFLEEEDSEINLASLKDPNKALENFREWQAKMNPGDDTHPNHHDLALLLTRVNVYGDDQNADLLGLARLAGTCDPHNQAAICQDTGLILGFVIAHEIGHTLGMMHDTFLESGCNGSLPHNQNTVMAPEITIMVGDWSLCSQRYLRLFMESGFGHCLKDKPSNHPFSFVDMLPGVMYGAEFQCQSFFNPSATLCDTGLRCDTLECSLPNTGCIDTHTPPAPGTSCGEKQWCYRGECLEVGERPGAVDGDWGPWSPWSECSRTCGSGVSYSERRCDSPFPANGGKACKGENRRHKICSSEPCDLGMPRFRDVQCSKFDEWVFPEDGQVHTWKAHMMPHENPCSLFCMNEKGDVADLEPRVIDGTSCLKGIRDICIAGKCEEIPCDMDLESNAVEDVCGICHGDGTTCSLKYGEKFFEAQKTENKSHELVKLIDIPEDTQNIKVEEIEPTQSRLQVRSSDGKFVHVKGSQLGMFEVPGSRAWLGMIRVDQEALNIPGPISEPLTIWVLLLENVTVKYTMAVKTERRPATFAWDFTDWSMCSAICGPGTEQASARCVEKSSGVVDDKYCTEPKPKDKVRPCEIAPCLPRWMIGDWQRCCESSGNSNLDNPHGTSYHHRLVKCMKPVGNQEGELIILPDGECQPPKPKETEECNLRKKRRVSHRQSHPTPKTCVSCKQKPWRSGSRRRVIRTFAVATDNSTNLHQQVNDAVGERNKFTLERGKTVIDKSDHDCLKLTINANIKDNDDVTDTKSNSKDCVKTLRGKEALKFIEKIQTDKKKNDKIK